MKSPPQGTYALEREKRPFWNKKGLALMSFVIPFAVLGLAYGALQVFPFGGRHMLTVDLFHQYAPFLALLRDKLLSSSSLFYTTISGLGTNFYVLFAYYLASPFNLLLLLFPPAYLTEAVYVITLIKIGCAGLAFFYYLRISFRRRGALAVAFSTFYALSGYVIAYSWNIMWLDTLICLPLVLLALVRQVRDKKWLLYPLSLALLLVTNYYLAFFACLFLALYYPVILFRYTIDRQPLERLKTFGRTVGLTLVGAALSAVLLYPVYRSLAITSAAGDRFPETIELLGRPLAYLGQLFPFLQPTVRSGSPNLYCGLPVLLLLPVFFLSGRIRLREKILNALLLLFLLLSFDINILNFLWHGMHYPNQLPYRFSFVVILLLLTLAYDGLRSMREFRPAEIGLLGLCITLVIPIVASIEPDIKLSPWTQWGAIAFMAVYTLIFSSFRARKYKGRLQVNILIAVMLLEVVLSTFSGLYYMDRNEYYGNRDSYSAGDTVHSIRQAVSQVDKLNQGDGFYRLELRPHKTSNDPALYGYRGLSLFASTSPGDPVSFFRSFGFQNNGINSYQYRGATLFSEAFLGIRYVIAREKTGL
ncbi:MAG: YfhO family protein, partial [Clostridiaceae bacterium]|nr:YfhO family protein [Clostridiaceae bacterium]